MFAQRWLWIALVLLVSASGIANAQVLTMTPDPINVGNVPVNGMGSSTGVLTSDSTTDVDIVLGTCGITTGNGTFSLSAPGGLTNVNLTSTKNVTITATYSPLTRGLRECTVNVYPTGTTMTPLYTFKVRGTGVAPVISTTPATAHNFGAIRFNNAATLHTGTLNLVVTNNGDAGQDLIVNNISFVGGLMGDYSVAGTIPATIAPSTSATFVVTFDPAMAGASSTTLQIDSNDPAAATKNIALSGTGATGVISVTDIPFGTVAVGSSPSQNITVSNIGAGTRGLLTVTQATFNNNTAGWFKFNATSCPSSTTTCPLTMSMTNGTATLPVMCNPPTTEPAGTVQTATIVFTSDTDDATDSVATVSCTSGRADMAVDQTPLAFGDQLVNTTSTAQTVMISNSGNMALTYSLSLGGTNPGQFVVTGVSGCTTSCSLAAMSSALVSVSFRPLTVGMKSALLRVTATNDPDTTSLDVPLSGNGVAPVSSPSANNLAFGDIDVGDTSTAQTLTITNNGTYPLTISAAYLATGAADYTVTSGTTGTAISITVQPTETASWMIACRPSAMNSRPGTFRITSNHNGVTNTSQDIALACNGLRGILAFATTPANPYDFGGVREGETRDVTFTLRNIGNTPVTNIGVAFSGTGTGYTILSPTFPIASIAAAGSVSITVRFAPLDGTYGGTYVATFSGTWGTAKTTMTTLTLNGDGLTTGYDTSPSNPNALDFGDVRYDLMELMYVSIINTAGTALQIRGYTITPGTAMTGEFVVTRCFKNSVQIACPTMAAPYNSSGLNDTIVLEVRCDPANRVAMLDATLTVMSDLPMNPSRTVPLKANSVSADIALDPATMVLDFGPTDLDAMPVSVTRTVRLTNTGVAPLDITSVTKIGGPLGNVRFTFSTTTAPFSLAPGANYNIDVTYTPVIEKPSNQPDTGTITFAGVAGAIGKPSTITIQLSGYGADRHIALGPAPTFPDTYKNPGDKAPVLPVTVTNMGDAMLSLSAVMVTNEPIWTIVNPDPADVPGRGTHDFNVKFSPQMAGKAPVGHLTIINNDNGMPMASVDLNGNGLARNVAVGPGEIDLGYVGIGMTVRLSEIAPTELLSVTNADSVPWPITDVTISGGNGAFAVETTDGGSPAGIMLQPSTSQQFEILFTPNYEGDFVADATVILDGDPQAPVTLRGRGLYVDTRGGGGCSTGRDGGIALVLVMIALVLGRRRRAYHGAAATVVMLVGVHAARADQTRNANPTVFDPTPAASTETTFHLQGAEVAEQGAYGVFALISYANKPLILDTAQNDHVTVENRTMLELGGAYAFDAFEVGARMPFYVQSGDALPTMDERRERFGVAPGGTAIGDLTLHGKYQIGARDELSYGIGAALTLPTASDGEFAGMDLPTGRALFLLSAKRGPFTASLNAGGIVRQRVQVGSATQGSGGLFGAGLSWRVLDKLWLAGEIFGELIPGGESGQPASGQAMGESQLGKPIEGLVGMRYQMARTTSLGIAAGRGVTSDMGTPAVRAVVTLSYTPSADELAPLPRAPKPIPKDVDGDAIKDTVDSCPNEPEDKDLFDDDDGCPDHDNDGDGRPDVADKCPLDAEDKDNFKDDDGCPEKDNDADTVPDAQDRCANAAEDRDGFEDQDGCPEPDNDTDGLLDTVDKCPREPETINGNSDDDGCPDKGNSLVVLSPDRLELLESVQVHGSKVAKSSENVLGQVGATLRAHPEIMRVRLTAHVQPTSNATADQKLSEQRARIVRDWLIEWGVDPLRLQASGFGGSKPLVPPTQRGAQQINDRFDLIILERK